MKLLQRPGAALGRADIKRVVTAALCILTMALAGGLGGCSSDKSEFSGKASPRYDGPNPIPRGGGAYKVGNPYKIAGKTYTPREDPDYDKFGMASWYGEAFHKRQTANGEWFDMNALTAAHPTLPIPSYVRVTNQKNQRSLVVRVNDRGPYAHGRIIDMSKRSAKELGFQNDGITKVRVEYLGPAPLEYEDADIVAMNEKYRRGGRPDRRFTEAPATRTQSNVIYTGSVNPASAQPRGYYVQAATFSNRDYAAQLRQRLSSIGKVTVDEHTVGRSTYYRVRVGPLHDEAAAHQALQQVVSAGQPDAHLVSP